MTEPASRVMSMFFTYTTGMAGRDTSGNRKIDRKRIVDAAVELAESRSWEAVWLHEVALALGVELAEIQVFFREKDEIVDAFFDRADQAAVAVCAEEGFADLPSGERMVRSIMAWLDALAAHRCVVRQMIGAKAEIGHLHIQIPALMRISRTVQWFREAAGYRDTLPGRAFVEALHTAIYLAAFVRWMRDESPDSDATRAFLERGFRISR